MESVAKCNDTTEENIPNTSGKAAKRGVVGKYQLLDLHRLTFRLDEVEQAIDAETATPEQFNSFAEAFADVEDVNVNVWPLEVRRDLINELYEFCLTEGYDFPLTEVADEAAQQAEGA